MNAFGILPKVPWDNTGFRVWTDYATASSGIAETANIPDAPDLSSYILEVGADIMKPKTLAHSFEVSEILDELSNRGDDVMGDPLNTLKEIRALQHINDANTMLCRSLEDFDTDSVDPTGSTFYDFDSIDHVISSYSEIANTISNTGYGDIYGIDRHTAASWADSVVDHNNGTLRNLTLEMLDDAFNSVWEAGGSPKVILTGYKTKQVLGQLLESNRRFQMPTQYVTPTYNGVKSVPGAEGAFQVATYNGVPIIASRHVNTDGTGSLPRIYLLDTDYLEFRVLRPTMYYEAGVRTGDPLIVNKWRIPLFSKPCVVERKHSLSTQEKSSSASDSEWIERRLNPETKRDTKIYHKSCIGCGEWFETRKSYVKYCTKKCGASHSPNHHIFDTEGAKKAQEYHKGKKLTLETRKKISEANKGREFSEEHRKALADKKRGTTQSDITKARRSISLKEAWKREDVRAKHGKQEYKRSSLEIMFEEELERQGVKFYIQQFLMKKYKVDFLIYGDIVVECDGEYWHSREWVKEKDIKRDEELSTNGWIVRRFKETDIRNDVKSCVDSLIQEFPFIKVYSGKEELKQDRQQKLYKMKYEQKMANRAIAKEFHVRRSTIRTWLKEIENNDSAWICTKGCLPHRGQSRLPQI